jgi:DNA replication and repair protein RecF
MSLIELTVDDVRCLQHVELSLHPRLNLIWGSNGSGKTSLLEAVFLLGRGRSFRTRNSERLIRHGQQRLVVFGRTDGLRGVPHSLGIQVSKGSSGFRQGASRAGEPGAVDAQSGGQVGSLGAGNTGSSMVGGAGPGERPTAAGTIARIDGSTAASLTELSEAFPVQVIDPGVHKLVEEGGYRRRRWMDWAVFHVEHGFGDLWVRYTRAVKQRNAALKRQPAQASAWDPEVARLGELIAEARRNVLEKLQPAWRDSVSALSGLEVDLHYSRGWNQDVSLAQALADSRARDQAKGLTHNGPHRADVLVRIGGRAAREVLSRGQQKLVAIAMTLAQIRLLQDLSDTTPTLLLDDPAAELDGTRLQGFIEQVRQLGCQLILTSLRGPSQGNSEGLFGKPDRVFHVEQGGVAPV